VGQKQLPTTSTTSIVRRRLLSAMPDELRPLGSAHYRPGSWPDSQHHAFNVDYGLAVIAGASGVGHTSTTVTLLATVGLSGLALSEKLEGDLALAGAHTMIWSVVPCTAIDARNEQRFTDGPRWSRATAEASDPSAPTRSRPCSPARPQIRTGLVGVCRAILRGRQVKRRERPAGPSMDSASDVRFRVRPDRWRGPRRANCA